MNVIRPEWLPLVHRNRLNHHASARAFSCTSCHNGKRAFGGDDFSTAGGVIKGTVHLAVLAFRSAESFAVLGKSAMLGKAQ